MPKPPASPTAATSRAPAIVAIGAERIGWVMPSRDVSGVVMGILVLRFRSSHHVAAPSFANFGIKGALANFDSSAALTLKFRWRMRGITDRNFKVAALLSSSGQAA